MDYATFEQSLLAPMRALGYEGVMQDSRKRSDTQPCGNATFWKAAKFALEDVDHRSRVLVTLLNYTEVERRRMVAARERKLARSSGLWTSLVG